MKTWMCGFIFFAAAFATAGTATQGPCGIGSAPPARYEHVNAAYVANAQSKFVALINQYRARKGLSSLRAHTSLKRAARIQAVDMANGEFLSHQGSDGSQVMDRVARVGYRFRRIGENLGIGYPTVEDMFRAWRESPGHDRNLLMPEARDVGFELVFRPGSNCGAYWAMVIGRPI